MTISSLLRYLVGQRRAIGEIADTPSAVWSGLLFVLSAGLAREYDGADLLHEPWHLVLPLGASLATSFLLFGMLWLAASKQQCTSASFARSYRMFLTLYWMTAPLAWLYAVPVERWLSDVDATRANLWLLGIVAAWRVALMIRVVSVIFEARSWQALPIVMLFADTVALVLLYAAPLPVLSVMGGIRLSDSESLISEAALLATVLGGLSWPMWLIGTAVVVYCKRLTRPAAPLTDGRVSHSTWALGLASLLVWIAVLPPTQHEQQLGRVVEKNLRDGRIEQALATMSLHERTDFPPHWDPPPRIGYGEQQPPILDIVEHALANEGKPWVLEIFVHKLKQSAGTSIGAYEFWETMESDRFDRLLTVLEQLPDRSSFLREHREALENQMESDSPRTEEQRARLQALLVETE